MTLRGVSDKGTAQGIGERAKYGIGFLLRSVHQIQTGRIAEVAAEVELTAAQLSVLTAVANEPGMDQRAVTRATFIDRSTVASVVTKLTERNLLVSRRNISDARRDNLVAAPAALALVHQVSPDVHRCTAILLHPLSPAERRDFIHHLQALAYAGSSNGPRLYAVPGGSWGLGRTLRGCVRQYGRFWNLQVSGEASPVQFLCLTALSQGGIDQRSLGAELGLDKASVAELTGRMQRRGLVVKSRDPADARRRLLEATEAGMLLMEETEQRRTSAELRFLHLLPTDRGDQLIGLLRKVAAGRQQDRGTR